MSRAHWIRSPLLLAVAAIGLVSAPANSAELDDYMSLALQGDVSAVIDGIRTGAIVGASERDSLRIAKIRERFLEHIPPSPADGLPPLVQDLLATYRRDWTSRLLAAASPSEADDALASGLLTTLEAHGVPMPPDSVPVWDSLDAALQPLGIFHISGVTRPHRDFIAWTEQDTTHFEVELTDRTQPVRVVFLSDFLSYGWMHFATFGRAYPGGWATTEALFCFRDDYDLDSEKFRVSYLRHEARHFADYGTYPALEQTDLEYRAKLTELAFAEESSGQLLAHFEDAAAKNETAPHAFANWALVQDLKAEFGELASATSLAEVPTPDLQAAARRLLLRHDEALAAAGARTTAGVLVDRFQAE